MLLQMASYALATVGLVLLYAIARLRGNTVVLNKFALFSLAIAVWIGLQWSAELAGGSVGEFLVKCSVTLSPVVVLTLLLFIESYTNSSISHRVRQYFKYYPLIAAPLVFTPLGVIDAQASRDGIATNDVGLAYWFQILMILVYFWVAARLLWKHLNRANAKGKKATINMIIAFGQAGMFSILATTVFASSNEAQVAVPLSLLVMNVLIYYSLARHGLFDVKFIITRSLAYLLLISVLGLVYFAILLGLTTYLIPENVTSLQNIAPLFAALVSTASAPMLRSLFDKLTNKIFYRDAYDPQAFLDEFNKVLVNNMEMRLLMKDATEVIDRNLKSQFSCVAIKGRDASAIQIYGKEEHTLGKTIGDTDNLGVELNKLTQKIILVDELPSKQSKLKNILVKHDVAVIVRLMAGFSAKEGALAYLVLGIKKSGNTYSKDDLRIISILSDELIIAIQNVLRFEEISNFNITLQEKVNEATKKLRRSNEKLKQLDETKDDFISMASHQLRTPLTSVKGYLSMVLEGDVGKITPTQREMIGQAFSSSQRMVYLIADLLNVSRLKTGKFVIEPKPVNLSDLVEQELMQLDETAKVRSLALKYEKPKKFPELMLDETKIRQVVMNFIDNAIYYTPEGGTITVSLSETPSNVELRVTDTGIGVPKQEQPHLFTKFYRAGNARKARPDGTGLGLFMAKKVIIAQGGSVIFRSHQDKGSTFGFSFGKHRLLVPPAAAAAEKDKVPA